jgi:hypothetical protein
MQRPGHRVDDTAPGRHRVSEERVFLLGQSQGCGESTHRRRIGMAALPSLQRADGFGTQPGEGGQLLLRQTGDLTGLPQPRPEEGIRVTRRGFRWFHRLPTSGSNHNGGGYRSRLVAIALRVWPSVWVECGWCRDISERMVRVIPGETAALPV